MGTELARKMEPDKELVPTEREVQPFDMGDVGDPTRALKTAETLVRLVSERCKGPQYVTPIQGKNYPRVEWWTTVGASLSLFPREEHNIRLDRDGEIIYEATVGVYRGDTLVTRASAICSSREKRWSTADEYAVKSMATTRATGKAYRIALSFLAVMAGLEPTSAEEIPAEGFRDSGASPQSSTPSNVKRECHELLLKWPAEHRDKVVQECSVFEKDGKRRWIQSVERLLDPKTSDKWAGTTLKRIRDMAERLSQKQSAEPPPEVEFPAEGEAS